MIDPKDLSSLDQSIMGVKELVLTYYCPLIASVYATYIALGIPPNAALELTKVYAYTGGALLFPSSGERKQKDEE